MTNLEYYKDELKEIIGNEGRNANLEYKWKVVGKAFEIFIKKKSKKQHIFDKDRFGEGAIDWLLEEHKEPIKLKKWEYDLLNVGYGGKCIFGNFGELVRMRGIGHFKGITDTSMTMKEIIDKCEVVE